jgi:hypothetical protein
MRRRELLASGGLVAGTVLTGCLGDGAPGSGSGGDDSDDGGSGGGGDGGGGGGGDDGGTTSPSDLELTGREFASRDDCAGRGSAEVAFEDGRVVVTGCITGRNGCEVPELGSTELDGDDDGHLSVVVTTTQPDPDAVCTQALTSLGYEARFTFEGGTPESVQVVHRSGSSESVVTEATN